MKLLDEIVRLVRTGLGLADPSDSRLTPGHGWLLPAPAEALRLRRVEEARRARALSDTGRR